MDDIASKLRSSAAVGFVSPYYNVAGCLYVRAEVAEAAAHRIEFLEQRVKALEAYLDDPNRRARSGVPVTRKPV